MNKYTKPESKRSSEINLRMGVKEQTIIPFPSEPLSGGMTCTYHDSRAYDLKMEHTRSEIERIFLCGGSGRGSKYPLGRRTIPLLLLPLLLLLLLLLRSLLSQPNCSGQDGNARSPAHILRSPIPLSILFTAHSLGGSSLRC